MVTEVDRDEKIAVAMTYLNALVSHDADSVRFAPEAWRSNNGSPPVRGEDALRAVIPREPVAAIDNLAWVVDGDQAIVFYDLIADFSLGTGAKAGASSEQIPCTIAERFLVRDGLIHEIEVMHAADTSGRPRADRAALAASTAEAAATAAAAEADGTAEPAGPCAAATTACIQWTAMQYLGALLSHDGTNVPLAAHAYRLENGHDTGRGYGIRDALALPIMHVIAKLDAMRWWFEGDQAVVFYTLAASGGGPVQATQAVPIAERFRVQRGLITEIEAVFSPPPAAG